MSLNKESDIQVSVCVVTYNQENYIAECLESLVNQQTSFKFEIIVGEDFSTDGTRAIVQQYVEQYPNLIIPIFYEKNVGAVENVKQAYKAAKGKYIAHVDGDDFALPGKLQKQFDILEADSNCSICSHNMESIDGKGNRIGFQSWVYSSGKYNLLDFFKKMPFFAHSSKMFRNNILKSEWIELFNNLEVLDIDIHFLNLKSGGYITHLDEKLGVYRVNVGISNKNKKYNSILSEGNIRIFEKGLVYFKSDKEATNRMKKYYSRAMLNCAYNYAVYNNDRKEFRRYLRYSISQYKISKLQLFFVVVAIAPKIFFHY